MGTPDFAVPSLKSLLNSNHDVVLVVTGPDKPRGRGQKLLPTPIKQVAEEHNIQIYQPPKLKSSEVAQELKKYHADLFVVVAFRILPEGIIEIPLKGVINLHSSLLPKYRGAAPIQWALLNGDKETGVTTFFIEKNVDTGDIILQEKVAILSQDNAGNLHDKLADVGAKLVLKTVDLIASEKVQLNKQTGEVTKAPKITREMCQIDWKNPAEKIINQVRAFSPYPGAFTFLHGKLMKIYAAAVSALNKSAANGELYIGDQKLFCKTNSSWLEILEVQLEGKKRLKAAEFLRGYSIQNGDRFHSEE